MSPQKIVFLLFLAACLTPFVSPPVALVLGLIVALLAGNPFPEQTRAKTKFLLQASVVLLGFGMNLEKVLEAGREGIAFTVATIFGTLALGYLIGKILKIDEKVSHLISSGTAICGGSAIAAIAPVIEPDSEEISVSMGTVFILNSVALFIFPVIGHALDLSQTQFGVWSAVAIHDTSSVVGAAARFGDEALQTGTTVKLARALWIAPVALLFAYFYRKKSAAAKIAVPYFILLFLAASVVRTYVVLPENLYEFLVGTAKKGLTVTLFLIGASLSVETVRRVGIKPFLQGVLLWVVVSLISLWAVLNLL
jgi:uncharacterized integral membrane protein (TIGR00698 family)